MTFKINAEITLKANAAIKSIQSFEKGAKDSKKEFSLLGRTISLDTKRMAKNLGAMALIAGGLFAGILSQSPHLRAEFKRLQASTLLFNVALGEKLQPTVAFLVDAIIFLLDAFLSLPDPIQEVIIITGFLTLVLTVAAGAAIGLWAALGPITVVILGIAFAIAAIIVVWQRWDDIMKAAKDNTLLFTAAIFLLAIPLGLVIIPILAIITVIKNWGVIMGWIGGIFTTILDNIAQETGILILWDLALKGFNFFIDSVRVGIVGMISGLKNMFNLILGPIINWFI